MAGRPMGIRKVRPNPWRHDPAKPWVWHCRTCRLECTYPAPTLPEAYAAALEHLEDEHVVRSPISAARDALLERLEPIYRQRILEDNSLDAILEQIAPGSTRPVEPCSAVVNRDREG